MTKVQDDAKAMPEAYNDKLRRRAAIADRLSKGLITPDEADAEAQQQGLWKFTQAPVPGTFDPMKQPRWTLPMALAWIVTRDIECVAPFGDDYRAAMSIPEIVGPVRLPDGEIRHGWLFVQGRPASWSATRIELDAPQAVSELLEQLQSGTLHADAVRKADGKPIEIPSSEWSRLEICDDNTWRIYLRHKHDPASYIYSHVLLSRAGVMKAWPAPRRRVTGQTTLACEQWLATEVHASPDKKTIKRVEFLLEAELDYSISERGARKIWNKCVHGYPAWKKSGAPKKSEQ